MTVRSHGFTVCLLGLIAVQFIPSASGAGFALYEGSARGNAMGGTMVARGDDPSVLFYNPAGMTEVEGNNVMGGFTVIGPATDVTTLTPAGSVTTETEDNWWIPPHLYGTFQYDESIWFGMGLFSRFGLGTEFPENWPGRYNTYNAEISTLTLNPDVALKVGDQLSLAAGVSATWFDLCLGQKIPYAPGTDLDMNLEGDAIGFGFNLGLRYQIVKWLSFGAAYQSEVKEEVEGEADIDIADSDAEGDITLPDFISLGLAITPTDQLSCELSVIRTGWSSYDQLAISFDDPTMLGTSESVSEKNWDDVWRYQFGVEYLLTEQWALRAGYVFDEEPSPDETVDYLVPANDRQLFGLGCGYTWDDWTVDVSYTYLYISDRDVEARPEDGIYPSTFEDGDAHMIGLSVGRKI